MDNFTNSYMPVVFHCTFIEKEKSIRLALWAEDKNGKTTDIFPIYRALHSLGLSALDSSPLTHLNMHVPGQKNKPKPSHPLLGGKSSLPGRSGLVEIKAAAILLAPPNALKFFRTIHRMDRPLSQMLTGPDLRYWMEVIRWLTGFLVRQDLVPDIYQENGQYKARFHPLFKPSTSKSFSKLVNSMPPCCLAACGAKQGWGPRTAANLLYDVSLSMIEAMATEALSRLPGRNLLFKCRSESIHDAWIYSLASGNPMTIDEDQYNNRPKQKIRNLPLNKRTKTALIRNGIEDLADILSCSEIDLLTLPGFGGKCLLDVLKLLDSMDIKLGKKEASTRRVPMDFDSLSQQIFAWHRPLVDQARTNFRLGLRLEEPDRQDAPWILRFLLQDIEDPSLLVPVSEIWNNGGNQHIQRHLKYPAQSVISALGRAGSLFPPIKKGLKVPKPDSCHLDVHEAHQFLSEAAWLLQEDGFAVFLPTWWTKRYKHKPALHATVKMKSPAGSGHGLSLEDPLQFDLELALGDDVMTASELRKLARLKAPLVRLRGQWVELRQEDVQAALSLWNKHEEGLSLTLREVIAVGLGGRIERYGVNIASVHAKAWLQDLISGLKAGESIAQIPPPEGLKTRLRPYQLKGLSWLYFLSRWGLGACLADDMGLGKTIQALSLIQKRVEEGQKAPVLLVCPTSVLGNWFREAARFTPELKVYLHHGKDRKRGKSLVAAAGRHHLILTSFALVHRDLEDLNKITWSGLIVDEAQNIKNHRTMQSKAVRSIKSPIRIAMTGTPVENSVSDLWSIMEFLNPGLLGTHTSFKKDFLVPIQVRGDDEASERLQRITGPFILRRVKTDKKIISDLPDKMEMNVFVPLTREQASLYQAVVDESWKALDETRDGIKRKGMILATLTKLKQICDHPSLFLKDGSRLPGRSGKLTRLEEMVEVILSEGDRSLIFTQFAEMGSLLAGHLMETFGAEVLFIHGGVSRARRDNMVKKFQDPKGPPLMVLSLRAAGTGLNLTSATHVFHFDRWWNPAVEDQATDRTFRIGQNRNVQVHKFVCQGTVEERINELILRKRHLADKIISQGEAWITELSTSDIKKLIRLDTSQLE